MKHFLISIFLILFYYGSLQAQVAINNDGSLPSPGVMLEVKKSLHSRLRIKSNSNNDSASLEWSNRLGGFGTDMILTQTGERGLLLRSTSDVIANTHDSIMYIGTRSYGFGTKSPAGFMHLHDITPSGISLRMSNSVSGINGGLRILFDGTNAGMTNLQNGTLGFGTNGFSVMVLNPNGTIGVGTSAVTFPFRMEVNGNLKVTDLMQSNSVRLENLAGSGTRPVYANSSGSLVRQPVDTGFVNVPVSSFTKRISSTASTLTLSPFHLYISAAAPDGLHAPVYLPHGARILDITFVFKDNSANNFQFNFLYTVSTIEASYVLATYTTIGASATIQSATVDVGDFNVNNQDRSFLITVSPAAGSTWDGTNLAIQRIYISYEY